MCIKCSRRRKIQNRPGSSHVRQRWRPRFTRDFWLKLKTIKFHAEVPDSWPIQSVKITVPRLVSQGRCINAVALKCRGRNIWLEIALIQLARLIFKREMMHAGAREIIWDPLAKSGIQSFVKSQTTDTSKTAPIPIPTTSWQVWIMASHLAIMLTRTRSILLSTLHLFRGLTVSIASVTLQCQNVNQTSLFEGVKTNQWGEYTIDPKSTIPTVFGYEINDTKVCCPRFDW